MSVDLRPVSGAPGRYQLGPAGGAGTPLVLLPGIEGDARIFARLEGLARDRQVQAWDLPDGPDLKTLARSVLEQCPPRVVLGGMSLGGLVARTAAELDPHRVVALVTHGSLPHPRRRPAGLGTAARLVQRLPAALIAQRYRTRIRRRHEAEGVAAEQSWPLLAALPAPALLARRLTLIAAWSDPSLPPVPTLWLRGQVDTEAPWTTAQAAHDLPGVDIQTVPGGHRGVLTHPEAIVAVVRHFLSGVDATAQKR